MTGYHARLVCVCWSLLESDPCRIRFGCSGTGGGTHRPPAYTVFPHPSLHGSNLHAPRARVIAHTWHHGWMIHSMRRPILQRID